MNWRQVQLIFLRELRDQLRDRRTLFMIAILPLLLYPLIGVAFMQVTQFLKKHTSRVLLVTPAPLDVEPRLIQDGKLTDAFHIDHELLDVVVDVNPKHSIRSESAALLAMREQGYDAVVVFPDGFADHIEQLRRVGEPTSDSDAANPEGSAPGVAAVVAETSGDEVAEVPGEPVNHAAAQGAEADEPVENVASESSPVGDEAEILAGETRGPPVVASAKKSRHTAESFEPRVYFDAAKDRSMTAYGRITRVLSQWREQIVSTTLERHAIPVQSTTPFEIAVRDVAKESGRRAAVWSKILPFVVLIWAMTGAFYPAVDLCAGEKERGTLETLLSGPAERIDIVWGKLLTIMVFSISTALLNLMCMLFTASMIFKQFEGIISQGDSFATLGPPPLSSLGWLLVALVPISALFSALSLALATLARSTKEGQYYLMPLFLISMPLLMLAILPSAELDLGSSLIPLTGVVLLLRQLIEGEFRAALPYVLPVMAVTCGCCWAAMRWAVDQFNDESVLFRESERFNIGSWLIHVMRDRAPTPSVTEAILCGVLILLLRFFGGTGIPPVSSWETLVQAMIVTLVALVATPALIMAVMLTTNMWKTLQIQVPKAESLLAAVLLAFAVHPLAVGFSAVLCRLYPIQVELPDEYINQAPSMAVLLLLFAALPAICEELAFRGFILSGLRHTGSKWRAIVISAAFFGIAHGVIQQSILATGLGILLGYIAIQSGSIFPCMVFHATHNGLMILSSGWVERLVERHPQWAFLVHHIPGDAAQGAPPYVYTWPVLVSAALAGFLILRWLRSMPFQPFAEERLHEALERPVAMQESV
ncbi:MAG: CPBP family intramembrane metalloprotease [Planctomycetales bacterium]|nr:CPBP family intramembrane metalloprotease [Planctomycetales bacterium]